MISRLFDILRDKAAGKKRDYFLSYKYEKIARYYGPSVLDFGAGSGDFSEFLCTRGHEVKAVDVVPAFKHAPIDFKVFDGRRLPYADKQFATSVAFFVFHHLNNQEELLLELKRVTKKPATKKASRKVGARKPVSRGVVQGSLAGTATLAPKFDPAAPAFPASDWKHSSGK